MAAPWDRPWLYLITNGFGGFDHLGHRGQCELFEVGRIGHRHVLARHPHHRRIEIVEGVLHDAGGDLGADAVLLPAFLHRDGAAGLLHRGDDGVGVHRAQRAQVDHLGLDAFLGQFVGGLQRVGHAVRPGDDGDVTAGAHDPRLADRDHVIVEFRHLAGMAVQHFVFEEDHRIGIADRGLQQALVVGGRKRRDHLQAGDLRIPGRVILAVLGGDAGGGAVRPAEHDRAAHLAAGHVQRLGRGVDDLVDRLHGEVEGHEFDDRLQAGHRRTDADAGKAVLGDRRIDHAPGAEFLQQSLA